MVNHTILYGRLTKDPKPNISGSGKRFCTFTVAQTEHYKDYENTVFLNCVAWGNLADVVTKYFSKGSEITVEGRLETTSWKDSSGENRSSIQLVAEKAHFQIHRPKRKKNEEDGGPSDTDAVGEESSYTAPTASDFSDEDGNLPF